MFQPQPTPFPPFASYGAQNGQGQSEEQNTYYSQPSGLRGLNGGPIVFENPIFSPVGFGPQSSLPPNLDFPKQDVYGAMDAPPPDEMAVQEALARGYQPESKGPLVGEKKSTLAITEEYAKADPTYVTKTQALPQTYSHYRPVKGDGNCGWRAIGFSYFEALLKLGDEKLLRAEYERMLSLSDFVTNMCGHQLWIFEDMRDECLKVLEAVTQMLPLSSSNSDAQLLGYFNNEETSNGIVYWLRLIASAFMRANPSRFEPYIPGMTGIDAYCKEVLEPVNTEIEHLGMTALIDVLLEPIGLAAKINYLDRSPGTKVNHYTFGPKTDSRSVIHLLYRPGHYDIVYQESMPRTQSLSEQQILEAATAHSNPQINRVNFAHRHSIQSTPADYCDSSVNVLVNIPQLLGPLPTFGFQSPFTSGSAFSPAPTQPSSYSMDASARTSHSISPDGSASVSDVLAPMAASYNNDSIGESIRDSIRELIPDLSPLPPINTSPPNGMIVGNGRDIRLSPPPMSPIPILNGHPLSPPTMSPGTLSPVAMSMNAMSPPAMTSPGLSPMGTRTVPLTSQFRPSMYQYKEDWGDSPAPAFQTSTFKNSHYNVSHYNNPNFQPEQWTPDCDEAVGRVARRGTA